MPRKGTGNAKTGTSIGRKLVEQQKQYVDAVRAACIAQKEIWQQIPEWAYRANGRTGYSSQYSFAKKFKVWEIQSSAKHCGSSMYAVGIDLTTGEPVTPLSPRRPACDICLAACNASDFDAGAILARLKKEARQPFADSKFRKEYRLRMEGAGYS